MNRISNMNNISVRTYGEKGETLAVIRELKKLGIIKSKKKRKAKTMNDLKQESDMVGYVKTLEGEKKRGNSNIFSLRQIEPGMSQQQIADITERNNAGVAALRAEIQQQRLADIEQQQGQRFADITRLGGIMNPILERFRGAQDPGAGQRVDPFAQSSTIFLPDIQEETFTQTLNEGGPQAQPTVQTELFAEGEEAAARLGPQERLEIGGGGMSSAAAKTLGLSPEFIKKVKLNDAAVQLGFETIPKKSAKKETIKAYYDKLTDELNISDIIASGSKDDFYNEIESILEGYIE
jgi:hypothetical protein